MKLMAAAALLCCACSDECDAVRQEYADVYQRAYYLDSRGLNAQREVLRLNTLWAQYRECLER